MTTPLPRLHIQPTYLFYKHNSHSLCCCAKYFSDEPRQAILRLRQGFDSPQTLSTLHHYFLVSEIVFTKFPVALS